MSFCTTCSDGRDHLSARLLQLHLDETHNPFRSSDSFPCAARGCIRTFSQKKISGSGTAFESMDSRVKLRSSNRRKGRCAFSTPTRRAPLQFTQNRLALRAGGVCPTLPPHHSRPHLPLARENTSASGWDMHQIFFFLFLENSHPNSVTILN